MSDRRFDFSNARVRTPWREGPETADERVPEERVVRVPVLDLLASPDGARDRQLLYNDCVDVLEVRDGVAFLRAVSSGYVGYARADALAPTQEYPIPDHWVVSRMIHAYEEADIKSPERMALSMGTQVSVLSTQGDFTETEAGWIPTRHLADEIDIDTDPVAVAERLLGTPYLWGGNSAHGIDCSGLSFLAFAMCGVRLMPDSDLQREHDGELVNDGSVKRGDLCFWDGHVAIVADGQRFIHANAHHMAVVYEDIEDALARIGPTTARKRIDLPNS